MNITLNVNSTDRTSYVIWKTFIKTDNLNDRINICSFQTRKHSGKTWSPSVGDEIEVLDGTDTIFAGVIVSVEEVLDGAKLQRFKVKCKDWTHYLDRKLVTERYTGQTVAQIISDLVSKYSSGFTTSEVVCDVEVDSIAFNYITVSQAIQILSEQVNYCWYVDYDKDIHFFPKNSNPAPFNLDDDSGNYIFKSLELRDDISQLRNRVIVRGGEREGTLRTETFESDGEQTTFPLGHKFSSKPTVTVSGSPLTVGTDFLDEDTNYNCMWNYNERYIRLTGSPFNQGSPLAVSGTPLIPIIVQAESQDSIDDYGEYEFRKIDKSIKTKNEARQYAVAQLDAYKATVKEGSFNTYTSGLQSGQIINVQSTIRDIDEDFIIQKVVLKMRGPNDGLWNVELATLRTVGIIDFLQRLIMEETKKIEIGEDEVLEKFYTDHQEIEITEEISLETEVTDHQTLEIAEQIRKDPWTPQWVLAPYFPTDNDDPKRQGRLSISMYLY